MPTCPFCQALLSGPVDRCPSCHADLGGDLPGLMPSIKPAPRPEDQDGDDPALPFRPGNRPPTLLLCALDDGSQNDGEWFRVRKSQFIIGRTEGDIVIEHDIGISGRHLEITLEDTDGRYRFHMRDLGSRNGTFVRVSKGPLKNKQELLLGARRYYFSGVVQDKKAGPGDWPVGTEAELAGIAPSLVERTPRGDGDRFPLNRPDNYLGSDPRKCSVVISDDPFISAVHARFYRDARGRWLVENKNSLNGVWIRINEMPLDTGGEFQIGEQRFLIRIP